MGDTITFTASVHIECIRSRTAPSSPIGAVELFVATTEPRNLCIKTLLFNFFRRPVNWRHSNHKAQIVKVLISKQKKNGL